MHTNDQRLYERYHHCNLELSDLKNDDGQRNLAFQQIIEFKNEAVCVLRIA